MKAIEVINLCKDQRVKMIDFKFTDLVGQWQHFSVPTDELTEEVFETGLGIDGSSVRGWKSIECSDMIIIPDPTSAKLDPFMEIPTLSLICDVVNPDTYEPYERDPRQVAKKAMAYLQSTGIADTAFFGPEAEFFIFDDVRFDQNMYGGFYQVDSSEAPWNMGRDEGGSNLGHKFRPKGGYFPALPSDSTHDLRTEMCMELEKCGIKVERQHHEVGGAGQGEIDIRFDKLLEMADKMMWFKYIIKNVANRHHKTVTFMPKPIHGDNGSGMHVHMSLWKNGTPLFAGDQYAGLSELAIHFIGGILKHAPTLCSFTNPTTNSYKRLVPGYEAPIKLAYSYKNRSAAIRIPNSGSNPKAKRIEFRTPDPSANMYLAFAALLMAGIDGIQNKIHPGDPLEKDIYGLSPEEMSKVPSIPGSLEDTLRNLEADSEFLRRGDVFTKDIVDAWVDYKRTNEVLPLQERPAPYEFYLYYDL